MNAIVLQCDLRASACFLSVSHVDQRFSPCFSQGRFSAPAERPSVTVQLRRCVSLNEPSHKSGRVTSSPASRQPLEATGCGEEEAANPQPQPAFRPQACFPGTAKVVDLSSRLRPGPTASRCKNAGVKVCNGLRGAGRTAVAVLST